MKESYQDIQKLLEQFMTVQEAGQMTDDIRQADGLLSSVPNPKVSKATIETIQNRIRKRLAVQRATVTHQRYYMAVAAMVMLGLIDRTCRVDFDFGSLVVDWHADTDLIELTA